MKNTALESKTPQETPQKYPETLEEQRDYYLNFFKKWEKWSKNEEIKAKNRKLWDLLQKVDFDYTIRAIEYSQSDVNNHDNFAFHPNNFIKIAYEDDEINEILVKLLFIVNGNIQTSQGIILKNAIFNKDKKIIFSGGSSWINFSESSGYLILKSIDTEAKSKFNTESPLGFWDCNFEHITLENFDRGYFSPETNDYLNQMENEGKLTLINCTLSGLPVVRENYGTVQIGKKVWEHEIILDEKNKPLKTLLHKHLAFFC